MADAPQSVKLCPSCGASMPTDANLCSMCGYNFNQGQFAQAPPPAYQAPRVNYPRGEAYEESTGAADGLGIASLVFGILSLPVVCLWCVSIPLGFIALLFGGFGLKGRNRSLAISGMICGGLAIVLSIVLVGFFYTMGDMVTPRRLR